MNRQRRYLLFSARDLYPTVSLRTRIANLSWVDGTRFAGTMPALRFTIDGDGPFEWCDYLRPAANIPLFSPLLRTALEQGGVDNIDYYDAVVSHSPSGTARSYFAANVLGQFAAMDREKSQYVPFNGHDTLVSEIEKLVLRDSLPDAPHFFRLSEFDPLIVVDERVKQFVDRSGAHGVVLLEPDEWDGFAT
jgi:hypothetical protein